MTYFIKKFVANSRIIHNSVSFLVNFLPDFITHNVSKYSTISKCILWEPNSKSCCLLTQCAEMVLQL